jgi:hypothetical protein
MFRADGTVLAQTQPEFQPPAGRSDIGETLTVRTGLRETGIIKAPLFSDNVDWVTIFAKVADRPVYIALSRDNRAIISGWYVNLAIYGLVAICAAAGIVAALGVALRRVQNERRTIILWRAEIEEREKAQDQLRQSQTMDPGHVRIRKSLGEMIRQLSVTSSQDAPVSQHLLAQERQDRAPEVGEFGQN